MEIRCEKRCAKPAQWGGKKRRKEEKKRRKKGKNEKKRGERESQGRKEFMQINNVFVIF